MWHSGREPGITQILFSELRKENKKYSDGSKIIEFSLILGCD